MDAEEFFKGNVRLQIVRVEEKKPEHYEHKYCHRRMHNRIYATTKSTIMVNHNTISLLKEKNAEAMRILKEKMMDDGLKGEYVIQQVHGGPGRVWPWTDKRELKTRRPVCGMPEVCRLYIEKEGD